MAEGMFDVVDDMDRVVGRATRREVHERGWRHRAVHILVYNGVGEVFLQRRSFSKDSHPGRWDSSASGHLDAGEGYLAAAVRELREELGVEAEAGEFKELGRLDASAETDQEFVRVYRVVREGPFRWHPGEIIDGRFEAPEAVCAWVAAEPGAFARAFRLVWAHYGGGGTVPG
jgi:isopentenyl-diphosphate Delta-isomerase